MLHEIFYWVFNMSIMATITGAFVMLIRLVKKIPRRLTVFLWAIPFLRMILPFGVNSPYSLMSLLSKFTTKTVIVYQPVENLDFSMINSVMAADSYFPLTYKVNILEDIFSVASIIWIIVTIAIILALAVTYFTTIYGLNDLKHLKDNIYYSDKITSPAVYGIIKPKIILPTSYQDRDNEFVILHEKIHIRSGDNFWRIIAFLIVAVHWFNPICWLFLKGLLNDFELSCDERVLTKLQDSRAKEYALSLLESKQGTTVFASAFGGAKIRKRIENIISFKKMTWFSLTVFSTLIVIIFCMLLTNAG